MIGNELETIGNIGNINEILQNIRKNAKINVLQHFHINRTEVSRMN